LCRIPVCSFSSLVSESAYAKLNSHRKSLFEVTSLFGPTIHAIIANHHVHRDIRLIAEADTVTAASVANQGHGVSMAHVRLVVQLELQTILCEEYRYICHQQFFSPELIYLY
jgi:hypothetical protein